MRLVRALRRYARLRRQHAPQAWLDRERGLIRRYWHALLAGS